VAFLGKTSVNLNYSTSPEMVQSAVRQCGIRHVLTSRLFTQKIKLDVGPEVEVVYLEDFRKIITKWQRLRAFLSVLLVPSFFQERVLLAWANTPGTTWPPSSFPAAAPANPRA